jgi:hypothetical protein
MLASPHKKFCQRCGKGFLTYEDEMEFCNHDCWAKHEYYKRYPEKDICVTRQGKCLACGCSLVIKGHRSLMFCTDQCKRNHIKNEYTKKSIEKAKSTEKTKRRKVSYEELNRREEYKRVFEDDSWLYKRNRDRI